MTQTVLKDYLMKDITYLSYLQNKEQLQQIQYKNKSLYKSVATVFRTTLSKSEPLKRLYMSDIFDSTNSKTFTEFMQCLGANTELYNEYEKVVSAVANIFDDIEGTLIADICLIVYTLDTYIGLMKEYLIIELLKSEGFIVGTEFDRLLDDSYKVDILVRHPKSTTAVAIQCKSNTFRNISKDNKNKSIEGLRRFKDQYKTFEELQQIDTIELKYLFYDKEGYSCINSNTLIDIDTIERNYFSFDINKDFSLMKQKEVLIVNTDDDLIRELKGIFNL